jgi:hypothetical protein
MSRTKKLSNAIVVAIMLVCCGLIGLTSCTPNDETETEKKITDESAEIEEESTKSPTDIPPTNTATPFPVVIVSVNNANTRIGPGENYEKLSLVAKGEELQVLATDDSGTWYNVILPGGDHAWIAASVIDNSILNVSIDIAETIPASANTSPVEDLEQAPQLPAVTDAPPPTESNPQPPPPPPTSAPVEAPQAAVCECSYDAYNCRNFGTHNAAQACFNYCGSVGAGDIHRLDQDNDGNVCESLP